MYAQWKYSALQMLESLWIIAAAPFSRPAIIPAPSQHCPCSLERGSPHMFSSSISLFAIACPVVPSSHSYEVKKFLPDVVVLINKPSNKWQLFFV